MGYSPRREINMENEINVNEDELKRLVIRLHGFFQRDDTPELLAYVAMTTMCKVLEEKNGFRHKANESSHQGRLP